MPRGPSCPRVDQHESNATFHHRQLRTCLGMPSSELDVGGSPTPSRSQFLLKRTDHSPGVPQSSVYWRVSACVCRTRVCARARVCVPCVGSRLACSIAEQLGKVLRCRDRSPRIGDENSSAILRSPPHRSTSDGLACYQVLDLSQTLSHCEPGER